MSDMATIMKTILESSMPTDEEHREAALQWLKRIQPTLIDQWPKELAALSMPTTLVKLDSEAVNNSFFKVHEDGSIDKTLRDLAEELDNHIGWKRKFVRLNSRSPKDYPFPFEIPATISGKEAVSILMGSMRIMDDLMEFKWVPEQPAYVALRDFMPAIRPEYEFRCFVKEGELIAVTHYDYMNSAPHQLRTQVKEIRQIIDTYFNDRLKPCLPLETVVFDIALLGGKECILIEINPYGLSDPCYFHSYESVEQANTYIQLEAV